MGAEIHRARILKAIAEEMAARDDPHAVTVTDVVARAHISRRTFYELYADREECFLAAYEWGLQIAAGEMRAAYTREARWQDGIRAGLAALLDLLDRETALARLCVVYALGADARVLQRRMDAIEVICEFVDRGRLEGSGPEPPEMAAEGVVGAVLAVIHTRLLSRDPARPGSLMELLGPLMNVILLPYMGAAKARRELARTVIGQTPAPGGSGIKGGSGASGGSGATGGSAAPADSDAAQGDRAGRRLTYRTARVLGAIGEHPGASNREVADLAGIVDQGQISRLLSRLESLGLIANMGGSSRRGTANAWVLTSGGEEIARGEDLRARRPPRPLPR